jgi:hypothetical protein
MLLSIIVFQAYCWGMIAVTIALTVRNYNR